MKCGHPSVCLACTTNVVNVRCPGCPTFLSPPFGMVRDLSGPMTARITSKISQCLLQRCKRLLEPNQTPVPVKMAYTRGTSPKDEELPQSVIDWAFAAHLLGEDFADEPPKVLKAVTKKRQSLYPRDVPGTQYVTDGSYDPFDDFDEGPFEARVLLDSGAGRCTRPKRALDQVTDPVMVSSIERDFEAEQTPEGEVLTGDEIICAGDFAINSAKFTWVWAPGMCVMAKLDQRAIERIREIIEEETTENIIHLDDSVGTPFMSEGAFAKLRRCGGLKPIPAYKTRTETSVIERREVDLRTKQHAERRKLLEKMRRDYGMSPRSRRLLTDSLYEELERDPEGMCPELCEGIMHRFASGAGRGTDLHRLVKKVQASQQQIRSNSDCVPIRMMRVHEPWEMVPPSDDGDASMKATPQSEPDSVNSIPSPEVVVDVEKAAAIQHELDGLRVRGLRPSIRCS